MLKWRRVNQRYGPPSEEALCGAIVIGSVTWNSSRSKDEVGNTHRAHIFLPGFKDSARSVVCDSAEECNGWVEKKFAMWLEHANLRSRDNV